MHTYRKHKYGTAYLYTVGFVEPGAEPGYRAQFTPLKDFTYEWEAVAFVSWLNGGERPKYDMEW